MENYLVSVIVPMYNVGEYISRCIESILNQTYNNIEIILVDDGSPDNSKCIADGYAEKDQRIKVIHKQNQGVSVARNIGIDASSGDYVCFVDGDDWVMPDYVEHLLELCLKYDADVAYTQDMFTTFHKDREALSIVQELSAEDATEAILCYNVPIGVYSKMFRRIFLERSNLRFDPNIFIGEGFNFNTACFQRANKVIKSTHKIYFYRRDNEGSAMSRFKIEKCEMALYAIENIRKNIIIDTPRILKALKFANWHTHFDMFCWIVNAGAKKNYKEMYEKCKLVSMKQAYIAFTSPTKRTERLRALIGMVLPVVVAKLMLLRSKIH